MGFYTEAAKRLNNITPIDAASFFIECAETEQALFEGLIELDFAQVYNESGVIKLSEADEAAAKDASDKAIEQASKNIFQRFLEALKKVFDKVTAALADFFNGTKSLAAKKLDNPRAKNCQIKDVWFSDYKKFVVTLENACKGALDAIAVPQGSGIVEDEAVKLVKEQAQSIVTTVGNLVAYAPTTKAEAEDKDRAQALKIAIGKARAEYPKEAQKYTYYKQFEGLLSIGEKMFTEITPKELGGINFGDLTKEISIGGAGSNIKAIFELLKKPAGHTFNKITTDKDGNQKTETGKIQSAFTVSLTKTRLALFSSYTKACLNSAKIARRNYSVISKYISGKVLNPGEDGVSETAAFYGMSSDLFCEQVFAI